MNNKHLCKNTYSIQYTFYILIKVIIHKLRSKQFSKVEIWAGFWPVCSTEKMGIVVIFQIFQNIVRTKKLHNTTMAEKQLSLSAISVCW